ncbi:diguanylate cyclase [Mitsuaria sp. GD03876]|uniref:bifunctional diguanylate cyclase/phosphodiesterase n=1 Tax=Mitsuaria sp. GD03876 TaxID=2975399 RepID=UPI002448A322|nr:diguanylate cyclase [Mitsuaria sp. GD03876]MDH0863450.1 diguanylate cyclase [Mitsuaria sp. GD03876]
MKLAMTLPRLPRLPRLPKWPAWARLPRLSGAGTLARRQAVSRPARTASPRGPMASWLVLGNLMMVGALVAMTALSLWNHRSTETDRARDVVENLAQNIAVEVGAELRNTDNALATIALRYRSARQSPDQAAMVGHLLEEQRGLLPQVVALRIADVNGTVVTGLMPGERPFNIGDRAYFANARLTDTMVISEPLNSRAQGHWCVILARRLIDHDGKFDGIVYAVVTAQHFVDRFSGVALGPSGAVSLRSDAMNLVARYSASEPSSTKGFGTKQLSDQATRSLAQNPERGVYITPTAIDRVERITAYRKVPGYAMTLFTGMSSDYFLAGWRTQVVQQSLLAALVALAVAAASALIHRIHRAERRSKDALQQLAREQDAMLQNDLIGMVRLRDGLAVWGNPALERMFGYNPGELVGKPEDTLFLSPQEHARVRDAGSATIRSGGRFHTQLRMRRKDGGEFWVDLHGTVLSDTESMWMLVDIDGLKRSEEKAQHLALRDALTNLPNRRLFEEKVGDAINDARRTGRGFAVCYLDLDGFKPINDQHGHEAGDEVLTEVAHRLQDLVRSNDVVARLGGDEFAILLSGVARPEDVEQTMQRCLFSIQRRITLDSGERVSVGASAGAVIGGGGDNCRDLLHAADAAMYAVKRGGKGQIQIVGHAHSEWAVAA